MARGPGVFSVRTLLACAIALSAALGLALATAPSASAQSQPPICQQYPSLPQCDTNTPGDKNDDDGRQNDDPADDGDDDDVTGAGPLGGGPSADSGAAGELPFTGYPLTSALLVFVILLLAGLALRGYLATRARLGAGATPRL